MDKQPIVFIDMDDVICDFSTAHRDAKLERPDLEFPQSVPRFFQTLAPLPDAIDSVNWLRQHFDVYILTAPSTRNPHCYTEKRIWIEEYFDYSFTKRLIISPNKGLLKGDYLIDDHAFGKGQEKFSGRLIQFGKSPFDHWNSVTDFFDRLD